MSGFNALQVGLCLFGPGMEIEYPGYDWYVDSSKPAGNNGLSSTTAFSTIAELVAAGIQAGDKIGLAKGSLWREQLEITVNTVTVEAYGPIGRGKPHLNCRDVIANAGFALSAGQTNVYEIALTNDNTGANCWVRAWENSSKLVRVADVATCESTPGSYVPSSDTLQNFTLYIHPTGSTNPTTDGKVYEHNKRLRGLGSQTASGLTITGIRTSGNLDGNGSTVVGRSTTLTNCQFSEGQKHNVLVGDGCSLSGCLADEAYYGTTSFSMYVYNDTNPTGLGVSFTNCTASLTTFDAVGGGFYGHVNVGGAFGTVTLTGCDVQHIGIAYNGLNATLVLTNCNASDVVTYLNHQVDTTVTGGTVSFRDLARGFGTNVAAKTLSITGMTFTATRSINGGILYSTLATGQITVRSCSFTSVGAGGSPQCVNYTNAAALVDIQQCTFTNWFFCYRTPAGGPPITSDYNTFTTWQTMRMQDVNYASLLAYQTATGQDANSTVVS